MLTWSETLVVVFNALFLFNIFFYQTTAWLGFVCVGSRLGLGWLAGDNWKAYRQLKPVTPRDSLRWETWLLVKDTEKNLKLLLLLLLLVESFLCLILFPLTWQLCGRLAGVIVSLLSSCEVALKLTPALLIRYYAHKWIVISNGFYLQSTSGLI